MGATFSSLFSQTFPPKSKFSVNDIPDLSGKVVIVTGGNVGIGYETIKALLPKNAKVYLAGRSQEKCEVAIKKLKEETGKEPIFLRLDLANLESVRAATEQFKSQESELHILFNNGGVMFPPVEQVTSDGYDLQFGTNVVGHFLFTKELIPLLLAGAKTSSDKKARVVNVSSLAHQLASKIAWDTLKDTPERKKLSTYKLYGQSKFGNIVFANELGRRYGDQDIVSTSLHPGSIRSELIRHTVQSRIMLAIIRRTQASTAQGALTQLYAGTSPETVDSNGKYFVPWAREWKPFHASVYDPKLGLELWEWLEKETTKAPPAPEPAPSGTAATANGTQDAK